MEFADVSGPVVLLEEAEGFGVDAGGGNAVCLGVSPDEEVYEGGDIVAAFAECGEVDGDNIKSVEEVFAKAAGGDFVLEVNIGGGDNADVDADGTSIADAFEFVFLENAKEFDLKLVADAVDFVEEDGAAVSGFEATGAIFDSAGEGAFGVSEEFAFEEAFGEGAAVDADEGAGGAGAEFVECASDEFFAGASFAREEYGSGGWGDLAGHAVDFEHRRAVADQSVDQTRLSFCFAHRISAFDCAKKSHRAAHFLSTVLVCWEV